MLYDGLLLLALIMVGTGAAIGVRTLFTDPAQVAADPQGAVHGVFYQAFIALLVTGFFTCFWRLSGQTLGMQAWRIRVQNADGSRLSFSQCLLRCLAGLLSWLCLGLGYWVALFNAEKRSWSDMLSNSVAVQLPKEKKDN
jgi:uncharacterized RDD family membrane protein YckC